MVVNNDSNIVRAILDETVAFLQTKKAHKCLFLGPPAFMKMSKRYGYIIEPLGKITGNKDGRFLVFSCDIPQP